MVWNRHTRLTHIGVRSVDIHLVETGLRYDHILDRGFTNTGFSSKVY